MVTYIYGLQAVTEAIKARTPLKKLFLMPGFSLKADHQIPIEFKSRADLDRLTANANHQGIVAAVEPFVYATLDQLLSAKPAVILILDHIEDPQNLGAIIRSANAAGLTYLVLPQDRAASITASVFKVASGALSAMQIVRVNALVPAIDKLKAAGFWIYASALDDRAKSVYKTVFNRPAALIVGNEHRGISPALLKKADELVIIPLHGTVQSLNVSVATGILLFTLMFNAKE